MRDTIDIIKLAREAWYLNGENVPSWHELERFAALVAAAEREACAKVCDVLKGPHKSYGLRVSKECAAAIRARGNT